MHKIEQDVLTGFKTLAPYFFHVTILGIVLGLLTIFEDLLHSHAPNLILHFIYLPSNQYQTRNAADVAIKDALAHPLFSQILCIHLHIAQKHAYTPIYGQFSVQTCVCTCTHVHMHA